MTASQKSVLTLKHNKPCSKETTTLEERLHKVLAHAGFGSRRMLEQRIQAGHVDLNGHPATIGSSVHAGDRVTLDGKYFLVSTDHREHIDVLIYHKPEGIITTRDDPENRPTVFDHLPPLKHARWVAIGRLDINTTGLLLLTTDGQLANALMHPQNEVEREYLCRIRGEVSDETIEKLKSGVELEDGLAHFKQIILISRNVSHSWLRVVICEGRNREVRRLWDSQGHMVSRLKRIRYGDIELPRQLRRGNYQLLNEENIQQLRIISKLGKPQPALTLSPILHQRRTTRNTTEYRPENSQQVNWSGAYHDEEARELRAFDRIREEPRHHRKKQRRPGSGKEINGNVAHVVGRSSPPHHKNKRGIAPGQELPAVRTWFAGQNSESMVPARNSTKTGQKSGHARSRVNHVRGPRNQFKRADSQSIPSTNRHRGKSR